MAIHGAHAYFLLASSLLWLFQVKFHVWSFDVSSQQVFVEWEGAVFTILNNLATLVFRGVQQRDGLEKGREEELDQTKQ